MLPKLIDFYSQGIFSCPKSWDLLVSKIKRNCFVIQHPKTKVIYMYNFCTCYWSEAVENWAGGYIETAQNWFETYNFAKTYSHNYFPKDENNGDTTAWNTPGFAEPWFLPKIIN